MVSDIAPIEEGALVCLNASIVMTGMFPLISLISRLLSKPLKAFGKKIGINEISAVGFVSSLATNLTTLGMMNDMDKRGVLMNAAFAVSASFVFGSHMAFTMAFDQSYILPMIVGKIVSGLAAVALALLIYKEKTAD